MLVLVPQLREALVDPRLFLSPPHHSQLTVFCHKMTTSVPTSEPAGGRGEGQVSLCPVIRGLSWGLLCLLGAPGERPSCF